MKEFQAKNKEENLTWQEHIRKRPGMYLGRVDLKGFIDVISGIHCDVVEDSTLKNEFTIEIISNNSGRLTLKTIDKKPSNKWNPNYNEFSYNNQNLYNLNLRALSALSSKLKVCYYDLDGNLISHEIYIEGQLTSEPAKVENTSYFEIDFELDKKIWGEEFAISEFHLSHRLRELAFLQKDSKIRIKYSVDNEECIIIHQFKNGLKDRIEIEQLNGLGKCYFETHLTQKIENFEIEVAFGFREYTVDEPFLKSYVNNFYTSEDGTHVEGLMNGLTFGIMKHFQKYKLVDKYKISEKGVKENLIAAIHVKLENPMFSGCVKNKLANPDIIEPIANKISTLLFKKIENDKESTKKLISKFEI